MSTAIDGGHMTTTELTPELTGLLDAARKLPPELVRQVTDFAAFLRSRQNGAVDYSDAWSEQDQRDIGIAALRRFESEHANDEWGEDYAAYGGRGCPPPGT